MKISSGGAGCGATPALLREERAEQAALVALIRVARLVEDERLRPAALDAVLDGQWRLAVTLSDTR